MLGGGCQGIYLSRPTLALRLGLWTLMLLREVCRLLVSDLPASEQPYSLSLWLRSPSRCTRDWVVLGFSSLGFCHLHFSPCHRPLDYLGTCRAAGPGSTLWGQPEDLGFVVRSGWQDPLKDWRGHRRWSRGHTEPQRVKGHCGVEPGRQFCDRI